MREGIEVHCPKMQDLSSQTGRDPFLRKMVSFLRVSSQIEGMAVPEERAGAGPQGPRAQRRQVRPPRPTGSRLRIAGREGQPKQVTSPHLIRALPFSSVGPLRRLTLSPAPRVSFQSSLCPSPDWQVLLFRLNNPAAQWLRVADVGGRAGE